MRHLSWKIIRSCDVECGRVEPCVQDGHSMFVAELGRDSLPKSSNVNGVFECSVSCNYLRRKWHQHRYAIFRWSSSYLTHCISIEGHQLGSNEALLDVKCARSAWVDFKLQYCKQERIITGILVFR
ncbi:uncharacterized protein ARMOST_20516 [Armillaria ostoyae]|uniref:Uncharacterized protein n=1 Tax=Armillaria ostoyae TaxID=47428 RepID=A0A284S7J4_ARMOS|nr:uncharacterized protein ARMOST_20516 [Armillaria ostoyae]